MNLLTISSELILIFLFSLAFLFLARKVAKKVGLVDYPNYRKCHQGMIPLVGGISIYASICFSFFITNYYSSHTILYIICSGMLVTVGILDDRFDISIQFRAIVQAIVTVIMMKLGNLYLLNLGYIIGSAELIVGPFGYILTLFAVWAAINAFNMIDGIDGLLGGLSCVTFFAIGIILFFNEQYNLAMWCFTIISATIPYILLNLGVFGNRYKVFMGDAGSTLIGFTIAWVCLETTQGITRFIAPVTTLWLIAIPLMDMILITYRRIRNGISPFLADRQHIHHLIMRAGFTSRQAFVLITTISAILASIGMLGENLKFFSEQDMLVLFLFTFFLYSCCINGVWRIVRMMKYVNFLVRRINKNKILRISSLSREEE